MMRSASSHVAVRLTSRSSGRRSVTNSQRASITGSARGTTTVLIADARVPSTTIAPAAKAATRVSSTNMRRQPNDRPFSTVLAPEDGVGTP
jgi:hypothetical protein